MNHETRQESASEHVDAPVPTVVGPVRSSRTSRRTGRWMLLAAFGAAGLVLRAAFAAQGADPAADPATAQVAQTLAQWTGVWVAALLTLGILSFLIADNPVYKVCESVFVGVSAAYWMVTAFWSTLVPNLFGKLAPGLIRTYVLPSLEESASPTRDFLLACVPLVLAVMILWRLAPKGKWISVWPLAFIIGTTVGGRLVAALESDFVAQLQATMQPLVAFEGAPDARAFSFWGTVGALTGFVGVLSVLFYFFFSIEHKGAVGGAVGRMARLGVWFLMITFGSAFGLTVMGRITLLAQRIEFLYREWLMPNLQPLLGLLGIL